MLFRVLYGELFVGTLTVAGVGVRYRILGPLEVRDGGRVIELPGRRHRELLALLLARANEVVSVDHLVAQLWPGHPRARAKATLQVCVSELRRAFQPDRPARSRNAVLQTHPPGYRLVVAAGTLDVQEFDDLVHRARQASAAERLERGAALLRDALGLWRGPVLADLALDELDRTLVPRLNESRLRAVEDQIDLELRLGRHANLAGELLTLVGEHPFRERLHARLMVALYRCGRQAEALDVFHRLRNRLSEELGIEPGPAAQRLHRAILAGVGPEQLDPPVAAVSPGSDDRTEPPRKPPAQLPSDIEVFTGREAELSWLRTQLGNAGTATPIVCVIGGAGGIGKSALAIRAAYEVRHRFPDGQVYANLHGATTGLSPVAPSEALGRWLRAFGVDSSEVPGDADEAAARFRSLLAGRRVLVVCDNALDATQVRPLLPAGAGCATLVTSRRDLTTVDNAVRLRLDVLSEQEAVTLLGRLAGTHRVLAEPEAAHDIARLCGHLPLAVRIAGAKLAARPDRPVGALAARLADERSRLEEIATADLAVTSSFAVSYHDLCRDSAGQAAARMFRLLSIAAGPDIDTRAAAALAATTPTRARRLLDLLTEVHLIEPAGRGRYRLHDLLRIYAGTRAAEEPEEERARALRRMVGWYLNAADAADRIVTPNRIRVPIDPPDTASPAPDFTGYRQALEWLDTERPNLVAATRQAAEAGLDDIAWKIPVTLSIYFYMRKPWIDWITSHEIGLAAAERSDEPFGLAATHTGLGAANYELRQFPLAVDHLRRALRLWRDIHNPWGEALTLSVLGSAYRDLHRFKQAIHSFHRALAIWPRIGQIWGKGVTLHNLGTTYRELGRPEQAITWLRQAIEVRRTMPDRYGEAWALHDLGVVHADLCRFDDAIDHLQQALAIRREIGDRHGEAETLYLLGKTLHEAGRPAAAPEHLRRALAIFDDLRARNLRAHLETEYEAATTHARGR